MLAVRTDFLEEPTWSHWLAVRPQAEDGVLYNSWRTTADGDHVVLDISLAMCES